MARLAMIGMSVAVQQRELARLDAQSRCRRLSGAESAMLAELIRLEAERERDRRRLLKRQRDRAAARVAQIDLMMGMAA